MLRLFSSRIQQAKVTLTHNETELLRSLSAQAGVIPRATITELAQSVFSSPSTIHRLIRKLGFKGYTDFKVRVEDSLESELPLVLAQPNLLKITISSIEHTFRLNQGVIRDAARLFLAAERHYVYGTGWRQKQAVDNFSTDLLVYGESSITLRNKYDLGNAVKQMNEHSVLLFTSLSGNTDEYAATLQQAKLQKVSIISVTRDVSNPLSEISDIAIYFADDTNLQDNRHWPAITMSFSLEMLINEILNFQHE